MVRRVLTTGLLVLLLSVAIGPLASTGSADGSQVVGPNGHLYQLIETTMTWHDARDYCATLGAHLVTIGSLEENQFVYALSHQGSWIGATDEVVEGVWEWVTGEPWAFEYWAPFEPNNCCFGCEVPDECTPEHYLEFWADPYPSRWNDSPGPTRDFVCEWDVLIDIKPGSYPNSINLGSRGVVPVAVLTTEGFDASTVDPVSVQFADAYPLRWTTKDVDYDGDLDLLFHFKTQELNLDMYSTEATLTGETFGGMPVQATDQVSIVP